MRTLALLLAVLLLPQGLSLPLVPLDDDAGSGRDARADAAGAVPIARGERYHANLTPTDAGDWFAFGGRAGERVRLSVWGLGGCGSVVGPDGVALDVDRCTFETHRGATSRMEVTLALDGTHYAVVERAVVVVDGVPRGPYRLAVTDAGVDARLFPPHETDALRPDLMPVEPAPGVAPACAGDAATTAGVGDAVFSDLAFAATKTGFRAVVAWTTPEAAASELQFSLDGAGAWRVRLPGSGTLHAYVLDGLPVGGTLCFRAVADGMAGEWHALRLANAEHARDAASGAHTIHLLAFVSESSAHEALVLAGLDVYAQRLFDATDGHVRSGLVLALALDPRRANAGGRLSCVDLGGWVILQTRADLCDVAPDLVFSHDNAVGAAANARMDGIRSRDGRIFVNALVETTAPLVASAQELGSVLAHEMGHYAFGMPDLYTSGPDCYDPTTRVSLMGASREAVELDDDVARCPNEAHLPGYVPSWRYLRERFPDVPDRPTGPRPGPSGDGGAHRVALLRALDLPQAPALRAEQDDAGSGGDAPASPAGAPLVAREVWHDGLLAGFALGDDADVFAFDASPGEELAVLVEGTVVCPRLLDAGGATLASECVFHEAGSEMRFVAPRAGPLHVELSPIYAADYRFVVTALGIAPTISEDAGAGRDAGALRAGAVEVAPGPVHVGHLEAGLDASDLYAFDAQAGDVFSLTFAGAMFCPRLHGPDGARIPLTCGAWVQAGAAVEARATLERTGRHWLEFARVQPTQYAFSFALD